MKKLFAALLLLVSCTLFAQNETYSDEEILSMMSPVGKVHNECLDEILSDLQATYGRTFTGEPSADKKKEVFQVIDKSVIVLVNRKMAPQGIDAGMFLKNTMNERLPEYVKYNLLGQLRMIDEEHKLSPAFYAAMARLGCLMESGADEEAYKETGRTYIGSLQAPMEKIMWAAAVSMGYHSTAYWKENAPKWQAFFSGGQTARPGPARNIAEADVSGIVYGGLSGMAYGAVGGTVALPGIGTVAGAAGCGALGAVTCGLGGSAKTAVSSFVNWVFGK